MKYPKIVAAARKAAENAGEPYVVYHNFEIDKYGYTTEKIFDYICMVNPLVRMLLIMPNGAIVQ